MLDSRIRGNERSGEKRRPFANTRVAKTYYERAAALGNEDAKAALKRIDCPYVLKSKRGEVWSNLCF